MGIIPVDNFHTVKKLSTDWVCRGKTASKLAIVSHMNTFTDIHLTGLGSVTCRNYVRLGYSRLARGVYGRQPDIGQCDQWEARRIRFMSHVHAVMAPYGDDAVLFGPTAFQMMGVALPERLQDWKQCHLLVPDGCYRPRREGVVAHRSVSELKIWGRAQGLPLLHPVDHWLQLKGSVDDLVEVGDGLLRRRSPILSLDELTRRLGELGGRPGMKTARKAVPWLAPGTDSLYETRTRMVLVHAGLPQPSVNLAVFCPSVGMLYHVDLGYDKEKLAIEYDGAVHVGNQQQMQIDALRRRHLQDEGWLIITVTANQLSDPQSLIRSVEQALLLRRTTLSAQW